MCLISQSGLDCQFYLLAKAQENALIFLRMSSPEVYFVCVFFYINMSMIRIKYLGERS